MGAFCSCPTTLAIDPLRVVQDRFGTDEAAHETLCVSCRTSIRSLVSAFFCLRFTVLTHCWRVPVGPGHGRFGDADAVPLFFWGVPPHQASRNTRSGETGQLLSISDLN